ncbi:acyl-CoA thioesterase, partial [Acinetobacter baumannii]
MKELSVYPVIYDQKVAWGDMDAFGHVNNCLLYT